MSTSPSAIEFILAPSGPIDLLQEKVWHARHEQMRWGRRALVAALFCWLPLLVASIFRPNPDADISFLKDISVHARFLLIVPILIFAEGPIGTRSRLVTRQFLASGLIDEESVAEYEGAVRRGRRLINSWLAEFLILALSATMVWLAVQGLLLESTSFWFERVT